MVRRPAVVLAPELGVSADELRTSLTELNIARAGRKTWAPELKISTLDLKIVAEKQKKGSRHQNQNSRP